MSLTVGDSVRTRSEDSTIDGTWGPASFPSPQAREALLTAVSRLDEAERHGQPDDLAMALMPVAACYRALGALSAAEDVLRQALRCARTSRSQALQVAVLCELADTACRLATELQPGDDAGARAARERARDEAFEAAALAHRALDTNAAAQALLHISDVLNRCGDHDDAAVLQSRAVQWMAAG
jgi:tetratricopeptide (TPR) repeat protein